MKLVFEILLAIVLSMLGASFAAAQSNVYIAQNSAGGDSGANCSNAHSAVWFNSNATGGNTYHLCGTFTGTANTTILTVPASGTSANPLVILFEPGAILTSTRWSANGAIYISGKNYITIDGGSNGIIQNTNNGTLNVGLCSAGTGTGGTCGLSASSSGIPNPSPR